MRMKITMMIIPTAIILLILAGGLFALSLTQKDETKTGEVHFTDLKQGFSNNIKQKQTKVVTSSEQWTNLWTEMFPTEQITSAIDFDKKMLIVVLQGEKPTGGYKIEINKIIETETTLEIYVTEHSPGQGCVLTQALTQPYDIIELKKTQKEINFIFREETIKCD